jgi:hypothetical protein
MPAEVGQSSMQINSGERDLACSDDSPIAKRTDISAFKSEQRTN